LCLLIFIVMITKVVANLNGTEFGPVGGSTLRQQIRSFYASIGGVAKSEFGDVLLDDKSVKSDLGHPNYRNKTCSFAAVKDVLEKGIMTKPMAHYGIHGKKQETGIISANIMIKGQPFKMDVVVIKNEDEILRVRCHDVYQTTLAENHHKGLITKRIRRTLIESPSCCPNGDLTANVEKNTEITKDNNIKEEKYTYMKKLIRLTESDLKQIVKESVNKILSEASLSEGDLRVSSSSRVNDVMMKFWADFNAAESRIKTIMHSRRNASPDRNNLNFKNDDEVANADNCLHDIKTILINAGFNHPQGTYIFKQPQDQL